MRFHQTLSVLILIALLAIGCGGSEIPGSPTDGTPFYPTAHPGTKTPPSNLLNDTGEIAAALADPSTANLGVWSLLNKMGVGVYTASGVHVMDGSETGPDDFWLYDFEIPVLVKMATEPSYPFAVYFLALSSLGLPTDLDSTDGLLELYRDTYATYPDAFLPTLFGAMGLAFEADPSITPLQEWLLMVDTFVPPNPTAASVPSPSLGRRYAAATGSPCDNIISRIKSSPLWGLVNNARSLADDFTQPISIMDLVHSAILHVGVETTLEASGDEGHEGHDGKKGSPIKITATAKYVFDFPDEVIACGKMAGISLPPDGPVTPLRVDWDVPNTLSKHGRIARHGGATATITDSNGETWVEFTPKVEAANGVGALNYDFHTIMATFNVQQALDNYWSIGGLLQEIFNRRKESVGLSVEWHEAPGLEFSWDQAVIGAPGLRDSGHAYTCDYPSGPWTADLSLKGTTVAAGASFIFDMSGSGSFEFPAAPDSQGDYYGDATITLTGTETIVAGGESITCNVTYVRTYSLKLNDQTQNVKIIHADTTGDADCYGVPFPLSSAQTGEMLKPLEPYDQCGG